MFFSLRDAERAGDQVEGQKRFSSKLYYHSVDGKRNDVGVILKDGDAKSVVEVKRVLDKVKLQIEGVTTMLSVVMLLKWGV